MDKPNLVGERFGRLLVIAPTESKHNRSRWICQCDCGESCVATGKTLREGKKKSCGCIKREWNKQNQPILAKFNTLPDGVASCNLLYAVYRWQAARRNYPFELSKEDFRSLTSQNCFYCGKIPLQVHHGASCKTPYTYNGIDRQDNSLGYTLKNAVPCCRSCNLSKGKRTVEQFVASCQSVVNHQNSKKSAEMPDSTVKPNSSNNLQM